MEWDFEAQPKSNKFTKLPEEISARMEIAAADGVEWIEAMVPLKGTGAPSKVVQSLTILAYSPQLLLVANFEPWRA